MSMSLTRLVTSRTLKLNFMKPYVTRIKTINTRYSVSPHRKLLRLPTLIGSTATCKCMRTTPGSISRTTQTKLSCICHYRLYRFLKSIFNYLITLFRFVFDFIIILIRFMLVPIDQFIILLDKYINKYSVVKRCNH